MATREKIAIPCSAQSYKRKWGVATGNTAKWSLFATGTGVAYKDQPGLDNKVQKAGMRYKADITAGALKLPESRIIADLLLREVDGAGWKDAIVKRNVLQARNPATARRLTKLIRGRLETMGPDLWK